jgi:hypothetical protein
MNITVLNKIESGWVKLDWSEWIDRLTLSDKDLETIIDTIDNFKRNRRARELVLCKFKYLSAYVTVERNEYGALLDKICGILISRELYEGCQRIMKIKEEL